MLNNGHLRLGLGILLLLLILTGWLYLPKGRFSYRSLLQMIKKSFSDTWLRLYLLLNSFLFSRFFFPVTCCLHLHLYSFLFWLSGFDFWQTPNCYFISKSSLPFFLLFFPPPHHTTSSSNSLTLLYVNLWSFQIWKQPIAASYIL